MTTRAPWHYSITMIIPLRLVFCHVDNKIAMEKRLRTFFRAKLGMNLITTYIICFFLFPQRIHRRGFHDKFIILHSDCIFAWLGKLAFSYLSSLASETRLNCSWRDSILYLVLAGYWGQWNFASVASVMIVSELNSELRSWESYSVFSYRTFIKKFHSIFKGAWQIAASWLHHGMADMKVFVKNIQRW